MQRIASFINVTMNLKLLKLKIMGARSLLNSYPVAAFACAVYTFSTHCVKQFFITKKDRLSLAQALL